MVNIFACNTKLRIIGLGDSPNDLPLLLNSDFKVVIPSKTGPNMALLESLKYYSYTLASKPNGYGGRDEINKLLRKLDII